MTGEVLRRAALAATGLGFAYLGAVAFAALSARPEPGGVAVVLGNALTPAGEPSPRLQARLDTALALYRAGQVTRVLVSGGIEPSGADEAAAMAAYLQRHGVPASAVTQDPRGDDTFRTACNAAALLGRATRVVVVTQWFHVPRTMLAMRRFGLVGVSAAWPRFMEWRDLYSFLREAIALPFYAVRPVAACAEAAAAPPGP